MLPIPGAGQGRRGHPRLKEQSLSCVVFSGPQERARGDGLVLTGTERRQDLRILGST